MNMGEPARMIRMRPRIWTVELLVDLEGGSVRNRHVGALGEFAEVVQEAGERHPAGCGFLRTCMLVASRGVPVLSLR